MAPLQVQLFWVRVNQGGMATKRCSTILSATELEPNILMQFCGIPIKSDSNLRFRETNVRVQSSVYKSVSSFSFLYVQLLEIDRNRMNR